MSTAAMMYHYRTQHVAYDIAAVKDLVRGDVLEIGAGTGRLIDVIGNNEGVVSYMGVELDIDRADIARQNHPGAVIITDDFLAYDFGRKFDTILFSFNVINEFITVDDKIRAIRKARDLLAEGGQILIFMPLHDFDAWRGTARLYQWQIMDDAQKPWQVSMDIKRDLFRQVSFCTVMYRNGNDVVTDSYQNSLATRNEILILLKAMDLNVVSEYTGKNPGKYPDLDDNIVFVAQKN
ncbi:MAG: class I SAM-dependent methyltransferase [Lactobacillales bacterium]|jgi:SAM-dependent methyltransferase|nr:class I SAM-dependent methyltransferase [Lactobacillales bacterium]